MSDKLCPFCGCEVEPVGNVAVYHPYYETCILNNTTWNRDKWNTRPQPTPFLSAIDLVRRFRKLDPALGAAGIFDFSDYQAACELEEWAQAKCEAVIDSILSEALNSGDGTYKP